MDRVIGSAPRVLVAEDDRITARIVKFALERRGLSVDVVLSGDAAWEHIQQHPPQLLVTDHEMPGLRGDELCRLLRRSPRFRSLPVIYLTGTVLVTDDAALQTELSLTAVMRKPFSLAALAGAVVSGLGVYT